MCVHALAAKSQSERTRESASSGTPEGFLLEGVASSKGALGCARADNFIAESLISWNYPSLYGASVMCLRAGIYCSFIAPFFSPAIAR